METKEPKDAGAIHNQVVNHLSKAMEDEKSPDQGLRAAELLILAMRLEFDREATARLDTLRK